MARKESALLPQRAYWRWRGSDRDTVALSLSAVTFTTALGLSSVALPLYALEVGRKAVEIGVLVALSALVQIFARSRLGAVMRRVADKRLLTVAPVALAATFVVLLVSSSLVALTVAWLVLGLARACFWTAGQTHAVRGPGSSLRRLATLNVFGSGGALVGPALAGFLSTASIRTALATGAAIAVVGVLPASALDRFTPFSGAGKRHERSMWRRPGVDAGCWAGATAGAWRGLVDSFVPVVLDAARHSSATIGVLVSVANAAALLGTAAIGKLRGSVGAPTYVLSMMAAALGLAVLALGADALAYAALALGLSGLGAGVLQTLGPALAAGAVHPDEKGDAMAAYGAVRTSAMFLAPLAMSGAVAVVSVPVALFVVASALALPGVAARSLKHLQPSSGTVDPPP